MVNVPVNMQCITADMGANLLVAYHSGQNVGLGRRTFPILHQTASRTGDHFVVKPSAIGQPT